MTNQPTKRITIDAPSEATVLAARHLDATEGRVHVDTIVDASTRSAITTVLRYIAKAHNSPAAIPTRDEASRYDRLSPLARALVDDFDELDLAEMLVAAQDELAALRAVARSYCPACGRGDAAPTITDWEQQKQRAERAETILARIQALADEYPAGIDTALIHEALDTTAAPAATEATEPPARTPPPPGDTREQLPDHLLTLIRGGMPDYTSTACATADALAVAVHWSHPQRAELGQWAEQMHARCRLNHKFTGQLCTCACHAGTAPASETAPYAHPDKPTPPRP